MASSPATSHTTLWCLHPVDAERQQKRPGERLLEAPRCSPAEYQTVLVLPSYRQSRRGRLAECGAPDEALLLSCVWEETLKEHRTSVSCSYYHEKDRHERWPIFTPHRVASGCCRANQRNAPGNSRLDIDI